MRLCKLIAATVILGSLLNGCAVVDRWVYRPDINQGNFISATEVHKLRVGQTKEQVKSIMGTPMLKSVLDDNEWYYVYRKHPQHQRVSQYTVSVSFDKQGLVKKIDKSSLKNSKSLDEMNN